MRIKNTTNLSNDRIKEIIRFVQPHGVSLDGVRIIVQNSRYGHFSGHTDMGNYVYIKVTKDEKQFPFIHDIRVKRDHIKYEPDAQGNIKAITVNYTKNGGYLPSLILSREEGFVHILAHELRHFWQEKHIGSKRGKVWGARGKFSERDADAYAIKKQREWRRAHAVKDVSIPPQFFLSF